MPGPSVFLEMRWCVLVFTWCLATVHGAQLHQIISGSPPTVPPFMLHLLEEERPPADVVRSLRPQRIVLSQENEPKKEMQYLAFEIPAQGSNEHLEEAQLRIYAKLHRQHRGLYGVERLLQITLRSPEEDEEEDIIIKNIINIEATPTTLSHVYLKNNSWFTINITNSFNTWIKLNKNKLYIYIHVLNPYLSVGGSGKLELVSDGARTEPLLLLMYDLAEAPEAPVPMPHHNVSRRSVQELEDYEEESNNVWDDDAVKSAPPSHSNSAAFALPGKLQVSAVASRKKPPHRNLCRRKPLYIDFAEIEYDTWIVAPAGYEAYQCTGKCFYPVSEHLSPTKHAIVQTLVHTVAPKKVARACCVPTRLQPISVLYVDQHGVLTYRFSYQDMVVAECGCR